MRNRFTVYRYQRPHLAGHDRSAGRRHTQFVYRLWLAYWAEERLQADIARVTRKHPL